MYMTEGRHLYSLKLLIKDLLTKQTAIPCCSNFCVCYERFFLVLCMRKIYAIWSAMIRSCFYGIIFFLVLWYFKMLSF